MKRRKHVKLGGQVLTDNTVGTLAAWSAPPIRDLAVRAVSSPSARKKPGKEKTRPKGALRKEAPPSGFDLRRVSEAAYSLRVCGRFSHVSVPVPD